jgi:hypothetical protein
MGELFGGYTYDPSRWRTWTTTTGGSLTPETYTIHHDGVTIRRDGSFVYDVPGDYGTVDIPSMWPSLTEDEFRKRMSIELDKEEKDVSVQYKDTPESNVKAVVCYDYEDLSVTHILHTLSALKGKLMMAVAPYRVKSLECSITPAVKSNIIAAGKKLKMYGKQIPLVVHFDAWGNVLSNEIIIGDSSGINLKIVDPEEVGEFYFELRAKVSKDSPSFYDAYDSSDVPF